MSKYKEFWITDNTDNSGYTVETKFNHLRHHGSCNVFHVIEIQAVKDLEAKLERLASLAGTFIDLIISFPCDKQIENGNETHFENCRRCKAIKSYHMRETMSNRKQGE